MNAPITERCQHAVAFQAAFHAIEGVTNVAPAFLDECNGALELVDVTDACAAYQCRATLRDDAGFIVGHVSEDGAYRLGGRS